jgi:hypothetical protein
MRNFLCKIGIHWYREKKCRAKDLGICKSLQQGKFYYVCTNCGKRKVQKIW